ncbi:Tumor protein [Schistosoma japonicum]|uniref:Tumor protein n=2 Tax=Schistosoma japonicum TaxID=6182 RepID=A0A4Z2DFA4_SCHJA|nr:p53 transcription factor DNA binding [Schistosoma japonicum]TNN14920.1 Tumor protein [Schistosoma japonicum]
MLPMDSKFQLIDDNKENNCELSFDVEQAIQSSSIMSKAPIVQFPNKFFNSLVPFTGVYCYKVCVSSESLNTSRYHPYQVVTTNSVQKVYVTTMRAWPITFVFRPPVTPMDFWIRLTPLFLNAERFGEVVQRCKKHETQIWSHNCILKGKSFIEILGGRSEYMVGSTISNCPRDQITVCTPIDVLHLLHSKSDVPSSNTDSDISLLPEVRGVLYCRLFCYNSCFGLTSRGEVELVVTLEAKIGESFNPESFKILGLDKIRVRCCSCPARDAKTDHKLSSSTGLNPRRLSLNLSSHSNIRIKNGSSSARYSCPSEIQKAENDYGESRSTIIIKGRKYFITMTDNPAVDISNTTLRNLSALTSEQWRGYSSRDRALKHIRKFYQRLERHVIDSAVEMFSRRGHDSFPSQGSQDSTSSNSSTADKCVGTDS